MIKSCNYVMMSIVKWQNNESCHRESFIEMCEYPTISHCSIFIHLHLLFYFAFSFVVLLLIYVLCHLSGKRPKRGTVPIIHKQFYFNLSFKLCVCLRKSRLYNFNYEKQISTFIV